MKPLIATPISHLFEDKVFGQEIALVSDCLEVRERSLQSKLENQWLFHVDIDLTHKWDAEIKNHILSALSIKQELRLITFQASRNCSEASLIEGSYQSKGYIYTREEMLHYAHSNVDWLRSKLCSRTAIGIENNNYFPTSAYDLVCDGDFLTEIVELTEIYFLLDIAHAMVTAKNKNIQYLDYLNSLPLSKLIQLHICQPHIPSHGLARDSHECPSSEMFAEVSRLITLYPQIRYLTIEYYKDKDVLINSINHLRFIIDELQPTSN